MNVSSSSLGTIDLPVYSVRIECENAGTTYDKLENTIWDWTFSLTKTKAPTVSIFFVIDPNKSGTATYIDIKSLMMNREEATVTGSNLGTFKFIPLSMSLTDTTNEKDIIRGVIRGRVTQW